MKPTASHYKRLLLIAENAAHVAGNYLDMCRKKPKKITAHMKHDVKLRSDQESEKKIIQLLKSETNFSILSEESGSHSSKEESSLRWIVDPLDGTVNYLEGLPLSCVSIALWDGDKPILGVVYDFISKNTFKGIIGFGAWLNQKPVRVKKRRPIHQSVLCTGFPVSMDFNPNSLNRFVSDISSYKKIRLLGSAALSLSFVAAGWADAYYEKNIKIWDIAAGLAIVKAAGGQIAVKKNASYETVDAYAGTNKQLI